MHKCNTKKKIKINYGKYLRLLILTISRLEISVVWCLWSFFPHFYITAFEIPKTLLANFSKLYCRHVNTDHNSYLHLEILSFACSCKWLLIIISLSDYIDDGMQMCLCIMHMYSLYLREYEKNLKIEWFVFKYW